MNRDLVTERWLILEAAKSFGFDGTDLADLALARSGVADIRDLDTRDFGREAIEEASDGLNYGTFAISQLSLFPDSEERCEAMSELGEMMRAFAGAWYHAERFRHLMRDVRDSLPAAA